MTGQHFFGLETESEITDNYLHFSAFSHSTPFFYKQSTFDPRPENVQACLKNCPKKLFSNCLVDGLLTSIA